MRWFRVGANATDVRVLDAAGHAVLHMRFESGGSGATAGPGTVGC